MSDCVNSSVGCNGSTTIVGCDGSDIEACLDNILAQANQVCDACFSVETRLSKVRAILVNMSQFIQDYNTNHNHSASQITSGTLDNARVNWAAPSAIGTGTAAAATFTNITSTTVYGNLISGTARALYVKDDGAFGYISSNPSSGVNIYTGNTNTSVTLTAATNDILAGLTLTFTPTQDKVLLLVYYMANSGWVSTSAVDVGYKVNSGAITYFSQKTTRGDDYDAYGVVFATPTVTAGSSNTITMYAKNTRAVSELLNAMRVVAIEMAN